MAKTATDPVCKIFKVPKKVIIDALDNWLSTEDKFKYTVDQFNAQDLQLGNDEVVVYFALRTEINKLKESQEPSRIVQPGDQPIGPIL